MTLSSAPVFGHPLLVVERSIKVLVAADIHLGLEYELWQSGVSIPNQTEKLLEKLRSCLRQIKPDRLVLLGDIKHNIPKTSWQEKKDVPSFLSILSQEAEVDCVPGNHDGGLINLAPDGVRVLPPTGYILDGVGYFHGHTWPDIKLFASEILVAGHIHPAIRLRDALGRTITKQVWIRAPVTAAALELEYGKEVEAPEIFIVPAFNHLCGGLYLNESSEEERGPLLAMADMEMSRMYLLDGTDLGRLKSIKSFN